MIDHFRCPSYCASMASLPSSALPMLFAALAVILQLASPSSSISIRALARQNVPTGFRVALEHIDSGGNFTKFERISRAMKRGKHRLQKLNSMALAATDSQVKSAVHPGSGEFLMKLSIGTPPEPFYAIMDTGSDLIWTQCKPCQQCFDQPSPIFDPKKSSSFSKLSCSSPLCEALPHSSCGDGCEYLYTYGDYSSTQGVLVSETFTFDKVSVPKIGFGCGEDNEGDGFSQGSGLVGLGRGPLSLVSQLREPKFSYCLTSIGDESKASVSTLLMGSLASVNTTSYPAIKTTPLIKNRSQPSFYYLSLEGITVGETLLPIKRSTFALKEDGSGGMIIDSGTTISYLEEKAFEMVKKEFISQIKLSVHRSRASDLDLCFSLPSSNDATTEVEVPKLVFHFEGADLELPGENYMIADSSVGLMCLAIGSSSGMSIFGNVQQQNMLVVHDLARETISFMPTKCDQL
ncbi:aspartic proteinase nepenthesin-1-like [Diospyros lotus]|uniref:aspartic proteinase nepenthesin-1-like n=1 Tax=Diospyros lotus TaxID=55363 RepID=UPI002251E433|nr:aspartic proteinase nepenthesin-1-like [Diospyros lotus]